MTGWVDAFTERPFAGNPAGVVPDAAALDDGLMPAIAREVGASETALIGSRMGAGKTRAHHAGDLHLRYFAGQEEVDLCGQATVAPLYLLRELGRLESDCRLTAHTRAGDLEVGLRGGRPHMVQNPLQVRPCPEDPGSLLAIDSADRDGPAVLAYTGLWHGLVPVRRVRVLAALEPDLARTARHNRAPGAATTHVFALDGTPPGVDVCARDFAPAVGVAEDPQTGTASGAMGAWPGSTGRLTGPQLSAEQGSMRLGRITVRVEGDRVEVGGPAVTVFSAELRTPA